MAAATRTEKVGGWDVISPAHDDVVVRERRGSPGVAYVLGTSATPAQFSLPTREEAVTHAVAFAGRHHVRAWFDNGDTTFLLLGSFREDA